MLETSRVKLSNVVERQLPEHIREDYQTFVAFLEAYYEWLETQGVDYSVARDLDNTLDEFVQYFKKEIAYNLPNVVEDDRFFLQHIKDTYLAKGSDASYHLLFKILLNKKIRLEYPGQQMLRVSDGRWQQEVSLFAKVIFGDPDVAVGRIVEIETGSQIIKVPLDRRQDIEGEVERIVDLGGNVFEFFIDRKYYGAIKPGNRIKYADVFQAIILPIPNQINVIEPGRGFKLGQLFKIQSSTGTSTLVKVTRVTSNSGIANAEIIKFGVNYLTDFISAINPKTAVASFDRPFDLDTIILTDVVDNGPNPNPIVYPIGTDQYDAEVRLNDFSVTIEDPAVRFNESGFISYPDYIAPEYVDGSWAGTLISEFQTTAVNAVAEAQIYPAILEIKLGAVAKYPGYYTSNNGFISDSIIIQDSNYYQAYSYVIKIDERLDTYKSAVKTMLHPAGIELFGEYEIIDNVDLALEVESLIKSLAIKFQDIPGVVLEDSKSIHTEKNASDEFGILELYNNYHSGVAAANIKYNFNKGISEQYEGITDSGLVLSTLLGKTDSVTIGDSGFTWDAGLALATSFTTLDNNFTIDQEKFFSDIANNTFEDTYFDVQLGDTKYVLLPEQTFNTPYLGYVVLNSYTDGSYFSEHYVNNRDATFSSNN